MQKKHWDVFSYVAYLLEHRWVRRVLAGNPPIRWGGQYICGLIRSRVFVVTANWDIVFTYCLRPSCSKKGAGGKLIFVLLHRLRLKRVRHTASRHCWIACQTTKGEWQFFFPSLLLYPGNLLCQGSCHGEPSKTVWDSFTFTVPKTNRGKKMRNWNLPAGPQKCESIDAALDLTYQPSSNKALRPLSPHVGPPRRPMQLTPIPLTGASSWRKPRRTLLPPVDFPHPPRHPCAMDFCASCQSCAWILPSKTVRATDRSGKKVREKNIYNFDSHAFGVENLKKT